MKTCICCGETLDESCFPVSGEYKRKKTGDTKLYRKRTCKSCYAGKNRNHGREKKRDNFNKMVGWAVAVCFTFVTGIYQFDSVSGRNRTCTYESVYGHHSVTIDAMRMCPLTWKFEI